MMIVTYCTTGGSIPARPVLGPSITEAGKDHGVHQEQAVVRMIMIMIMIMIMNVLGLSITEAGKDH